MVVIKKIKSVAFLSILLLHGSAYAAAIGALSSSVTENIEYDEQIGDVSRLLEYEVVFKNIPGYDRHREILLRHGAVKGLSDKTKIQREGHVGHARGSRFELEVAFDLHCAQETIEQFGVKYEGKEFDIETPSTLIECKDINWAKHKDKKLRIFLLEHKVIADRLGKKFKFYSRRPIPDRWKAWLDTTGIEFKDTLVVTSPDSTREYEQRPAPSSNGAIRLLSRL